MSMKTYNRETQQQGLRRLYLFVGLGMGIVLGPAAYSVLEMGQVPTCI